MLTGKDFCTASDAGGTAVVDGARPLVYSCSGCSGAAQMANALALRLDRSGLAEMSCVAGIGGDVPALLRKARVAASIIVLDGCALHCAQRCLARHGFPVGLHIDLSREGVRKRPGAAAPSAEAARVWDEVVLPRVRALG